MRRGVVAALFLAGVAFQTDPVGAQAVHDSTCSYSRCALRVRRGFFTTRLVRGSSEERVERLEWFGSSVGALLAGPDSAVHYARRYQSRRRTGDAIGLAGGLLGLMAFWTTDNFLEGGPLLIGGVTLQLISLPFLLVAREDLDRSVWWYNRDLPRP
jgi:hypothetical protein